MFEHVIRQRRSIAAREMADKRTYGHMEQIWSSYKCLMHASLLCLIAQA